MDLTKAKKIIENGVPRGYVVEFFENKGTDLGNEELHTLPDKTVFETSEEAIEIATKLKEAGGGLYYDFKIVKVPEFRIEKRL